jgi:hypothetical protein
VSIPASTYLDGCRVRVEPDVVKLILIDPAGEVTASMSADAAERLGVCLVQAAWFAAHGGEPHPHPAARPPKPKPKGRRKGVARG